MSVCLSAYRQDNLIAYRRILMKKIVCAFAEKIGDMLLLSIPLATNYIVYIV